MSKQRALPRTPQPEASAVLRHSLVYATAFLVLALPLFLIPGTSEWNYCKTLLALVGVAALTILWAAARHEEGGVIRIPWIAVPILGVLAGALVSWIGAANGRVVLQSTAVVALFLVLFLIIVDSTRDDRDAAPLLGALLISAFLTSLLSRLQLLGVLPGGAAAGRGLSNIVATLGNRNFLGGFLGVLLLPSILLVFRTRTRWARMVAVLMIASCFGMIVAVRQVGVWVSVILAFGAVLVGIAIFRPLRPIRRRLLWLVVLIGLLVVASFPFEGIKSPPADRERGDTPTANLWVENSGEARERDWWIAWSMFADHPWTGVGLGNFKLNYLPYKADFLETPRGQEFAFPTARAVQVHNEYLQIVAETGVLGLVSIVAFLALLAWSFWIRIRRNPDEQDRLDLLLLAAGLLAFLAHGLVSFPMHLPASVLAAVVVAGVAFSRKYGDQATFPIHIGRRTTRILTVVAALAGLALMAVAGLDLAANLLMERGIDQLHRGDAAEAAETLERSLRLDFAPRQTYYHLAVAQIQLGRLDEAQENLERCFTRFVDEAVYLNYANLMVNTGQPERAEETIAFLLSTHPRDEVAQRARYLQGFVPYLMGDYAASAAHFEALIAEMPESPSAYYGLGRALEAQGRFDEARATLDRALDIVDRRLVEARAELRAEGDEVLVDRYAQLQGSIDKLEQERRSILASLDALPSTVSP